MYLFQHLSVFLPKTFFKNLNSLLLPFLWGNKTHRIARKQLCKSKTEGGLALLNFLFYYWALHIKFMTYWLADNGNPLTWSQLEQEACQLYYIAILPIDKSMYDGNVVIHSTLCIFKQIKLCFNLKSLSPITPIVGNPSFKPSILDNALKQVGLCSVSHLYWDSVFASFNQLQEIYKLSGRDFFRYLPDSVRKYTGL